LSRTTTYIVKIKEGEKLSLREEADKEGGIGMELIATGGKNSKIYEF